MSLRGVSSRQNASPTPRVRLLANLRSDGRRTRRPALQPRTPTSIDAGAANAFVDGRSRGVLAGRKETTRKLYRDAFEAFRRFLLDVGVDPAVDGWKRLPPNVLAAFYRWCLDHRRGATADPQFLGLSRALHTHDTRHHYARTVLNAGAGLSVVQDLLGHASPATTKRICATSDREVLRSAARAHAPRISGGPVGKSRGDVATQSIFNVTGPRAP